MADALTKAQMEILRRLRNGTELTAVPFIPNLLGELALLRGLGVVTVGRHLVVALSDIGCDYLDAAQLHAQGLEHPDGQTTWW